ncbi:MAG: DUF2975 domain-containing protein [Firmicutes bacterium]|nr:DUF2975 domain-containing protein [Bacillota bacterium]MDY5771532.1 DUF2975 domain-containing protein [Anaerovoracaceae bacterium]
MDNTTLKKVTKFGKVGNIVATILFVVTVLVAVAVSAAAIFLSSLPEDGMVVSLKNQAKIQISSNSFPAIWNSMVDGMSYSSDESPSDIIDSDKGEIMPPENREMQINLSLFNNNFSSATIRSEGNYKMIDATTDTSVYRVQDAVRTLIFAVIFLISAAASLWMLKRFFKTIAVCETPFSEKVVKKMQAFCGSLIPVAVFASAGETAAAAFLSAGKNSGISIQWGIIAAFVVTACLVTVFRYGAQLQRESDETL